MKMREAHMAAVHSCTQPWDGQQADSLEIKPTNDLSEGRWVDGLYFPVTTNLTE
jgi:hypothetical protein